jgi:hypothetical protein
MNGLVSVVIPASAPLGKAAEQFDDEFWSSVLYLVENTPEKVLNRLVYSEEYFLDDAPRCSLCRNKRFQLHKQFDIPWPCLKVIIGTARKRRPGNAADFSKIILEMSGIDRLRQELQKRFFAKSEMIKFFSVLSKASEYFKTADRRLRNHKVNLTRILENAAISQSALAERIQRGDSDLRPVQEYVQTSLQTVKCDLDSTSETLRLLGKAVVEVEDAYQEMNADLK